MAPWLALALDLALAALPPGHFCPTPTTCVQAGFCQDVSVIETTPEQPRNQLERWALPEVNHTHLVIRWAPSAALCGQTVDSYMLDLKSSSRVFNLVLSVFGTFPQDSCSNTSLARSAAKLDDGRIADPCGTYPHHCTHTTTNTIVELFPSQWKGFAWAPSSLTVQASGLARLRDSGVYQPLWCISFRKYKAHKAPKGPRRALDGEGARGAWTARGAEKAVAQLWKRAVAAGAEAMAALRRVIHAVLGKLAPRRAPTPAGAAEGPSPARASSLGGRDEPGWIEPGE